MADPDAAWNRPQHEGYWRRVGAALPMRTALLAVAAVWVLGCVWSFHEQSAFAAAKGFDYPYLLPLVIDGFAISMAGVAWAASLDARPAVAARIATLIAVAASSTSNGVWAYLRANHDMVTVVLGVAVPVAANLAFEVLLAELRRQVQRKRGLPPPVPVPYPRMIRVVLAPWQTFRTWRRTVLEITATEHQVSRPPGGTEYPAPASVTAAATVAPRAEAHHADQPYADQRYAEQPHADRPYAEEPTAALPQPGHVRWALAAEHGEQPALAAAPAQARAAEPRPTRAAEPRPTRAAEAPGPDSRSVDTPAPDARRAPSRPAPAAFAPPAQAQPVRAAGVRASTPAGHPAGHTPDAGPVAPATSRVTSPAAVPARPRPSASSVGGLAPSNGNANGNADGNGNGAANGNRAASAAGSTANGTNGTAANGATNGNGHLAASGTTATGTSASATSASATSGNGVVSPGTSGAASGSGRPIDPRVEQLAQHLASNDDADDLTGEMVGPLLNIDVAPRTGRRLLGQARELVNQRVQADAEARGQDPRLSVIGGR